jgi:ATP-dependent DNA ligase
VGIRNRSNNPILYCFPEFKDLRFDFDVGILDCELCVFKDNKSVFYDGIDQRRSEPTINHLKCYPATMVVFDALAIDKDVMTMKPYKYRHAQISRIKECDKLKIAKNYNGEELWKEVVDKNLEGVVIKDPNSVYEMGKRSKQYLKLKNYKLLEVFVDKTEANDKGTKIFCKATVNGVSIDVEAQLAGIFDVEEKSTQMIKYLDIVGTRLIQPTKVKREQAEVI